MPVIKRRAIAFTHRTALSTLSSVLLLALGGVGCGSDGSASNTGPGDDPFVPEAYAAWLVFFWLSNTMGHINVEIVPASVSASPVSSLMSHAITYHALHHSRYQKHYCFFLNSLDTLFGQVWDDYPEMHAKVAGGHPLTRLGERGESATPRG